MLITVIALFFYQVTLAFWLFRLQEMDRTVGYE
jgi:hypothetical protein